MRSIAMQHSLCHPFWAATISHCLLETIQECTQIVGIVAGKGASKRISFEEIQFQKYIATQNITLDSAFKI